MQRLSANYTSESTVHSLLSDDDQNAVSGDRDHAGKRMRLLDVMHAAAATGMFVTLRAAQG
jgi:hypothetical protein